MRRPRASHVLPTLLLVLLVTSIGASATAQDGSGVQGVGGAPDWVAAGTRVTHYYAVATVGGGSYELIEDPAGPLEDPVTGKRYRESFQGGTGGGGTGSGDGLLEATVQAVDGDQVVISRLSYLNDSLSGTMSVGTSSAERVPGAQVNGLWIRPDILAGLQSDAAGTRLVLRGEMTVGGTVYQAISIIDPAPGAYASFSYDSVTGVQIASALRTRDMSGNATNMSTTELRGVRQLSIPGFGANVPSWVARPTELAYAGSYEFRNPMDPSSAPMAFPLSTRVTFREIGSNWALFDTVSTVDMGAPLDPVSSTGATGGAGPYWFDPGALALMSVGQQLDADPWTGFTLTVSEIGEGPAGPAVAIVGTMPGVSSEVHYDIGTGVMLAQGISTASSGITNRTQLQQMP